MELREQTAKDVPDRRARNGGFPEPPEGEPVRVVRAAHRTCGGETRIRLSPYLPPRAVQRVVCEHCDVSYACDRVEEVDGEAEAPAPAPAAAPAAEPATQADGGGAEAVAPAPAASRGGGQLPRPALPPPDSHVWRWIGLPLAAAAVVVALILIQGGDEKSPRVVVGPAGGKSATGGGNASAGGARNEASFVSQPGFSLALPPGWKETAPEGGAAFAATATDGSADATLWIQETPELTFAAFEASSLEQLQSLTGSAEVVERVPAPTEEGTVIQLGSPAGQASTDVPVWDVTLRAAGPYRYHLTTTVQPGASDEARQGAELIHGSFVPEPDGSGRVQTITPQAAPATTVPQPAAPATAAPQTAVPPTAVPQSALPQTAVPQEVAP